MNMSVMPWAIASQTIPILAIAPMIIVVLNSIGVQGLLPKAIISSYLCFFPVVVGMVKGLRSPDKIDTDLLHTYNATNAQKFWKLRLPTSTPFLFASLKVGISASFSWSYCGRTSNRCSSRFRCKIISWFILRSNNSDMVSFDNGCNGSCSTCWNFSTVFQNLVLKSDGYEMQFSYWCINFLGFCMDFKCKAGG